MNDSRDVFAFAFTLAFAFAFAFAFASGYLRESWSPGGVCAGCQRVDNANVKGWRTDNKSTD